MEIGITEQLNMSMVKGSKLYQEWDKRNQLSGYLTVILYELILRGKLTQKELVDLSGMPKQSINKGIRILQEKEYLQMAVDQKDKRIKFCELTESGKLYAQKKIQPLFELENKTAEKMGIKKMEMLLNLSDEWNDTFSHFLKEQEGKENK